MARTSTAPPNATQVIRQSVNSNRYAEKGTKIRPPTDDPATMNPITGGAPSLEPSGQQRLKGASGCPAQSGRQNEAENECKEKNVEGEAQRCAVDAPTTTRLTRITLRALKRSKK